MTEQDRPSRKSIFIPHPTNPPEKKPPCFEHTATLFVFTSTSKSGKKTIQVVIPTK